MRLRSTSWVVGTRRNATPGPSEMMVGNHPEPLKLNSKVTFCLLLSSRTNLSRPFWIWLHQLLVILWKRTNKFIVAGPKKNSFERPSEILGNWRSRESWMCWDCFPQSCSHSLDLKTINTRKYIGAKQRQIWRLIKAQQPVVVQLVSFSQLSWFNDKSGLWQL